MKPFLALLALFLHPEGWIRHNQLGYLPHATKVAVYMGDTAPESFQLVDAFTGQTVSGWPLPRGWTSGRSCPNSRRTL